MSPDTTRVLAAQACRAFAYGFASVLLGVSLAGQGWSPTRVGLLFTAIVVGTAAATLIVGTYGDRIGRRRAYAVLFAGLAFTGVVFSSSHSFWVLAAVALLGTLSTDVVESGPFTTIEQAMLAQGAEGRGRVRLFGRYNAIATIAGSLGALAAGGPALLREAIGGPADERFFLVLVPAGIAGVLIALSLSSEMDGVETAKAGSFAPLPTSGRTVAALSGLFALDAFGGGFVIQSFIAYWFRLKFDVSVEVIGAVFFGVGMLQSVSFVVATRIAERIGLLNTMVFTHLPSNFLLAAIPLAPGVTVAIALLFGRFALSQMDVPTRQAYIAELVPPEERTAAVAYTNTVRYAARPWGAALAGVTQQAVFGLPFFLGGGIKSVYDVGLWLWFRRVELHDTAKDGTLEEATNEVDNPRPPED